MAYSRIQHKLHEDADTRTLHFTTDTVETRVVSVIHHHETRRISASYTMGGPLTSHPTTAFHRVSASRSPTPARSTCSRTQPDTNTQASLATRTSAAPASTTLPMPPTYRSHQRGTSGPLSYRNYDVASNRREIPRTPAHLVPRMAFVDEHKTPICSTELSTNHIDSLKLPATKLVRKLSQIDLFDPETSPTQTPKHKLRSGIPRARTLNVFSNLTASLSRTSLGISSKVDSRRASRSSRHASNGSSTSTQSSVFTSLGPAGGSMAAGLSLTIPDTHYEDSPNITTRNPRDIYSAQSSEYWSGRFMTLNDRLMSESLPSQSTESPVSSPQSSARHNYSDVRVSASPNDSPPRLTHSGTMPTYLRTARRSTMNVETQTQHEYSKRISQIRSRRPSTSRTVSLDDEDARYQQVFRQLEEVCVTSEARKSLRTWQQAYARRTGKEQLLPTGGSMEDRNWVGRLLSSGSSVGRGLAHSGTFTRRKRSSLMY